MTVQNKYLFILLLGFILIFQIVTRIPFIHEPLERDEGMYGYMGQRILAGEVPYRDIFDHKPPAVYYINAFIIKFFGSATTIIRTFAAAYSLFTTLALFGIGYLLFGAGGGLLAALIYAFFSGTPMIQGTSSNTETFMVLPMCLALWCFLLANRKKNLWWLFASGLFSGLAVMMKQVAFMNFLVLAGAAFFMTSRPQDLKTSRLKNVIVIIGGFLIVPVFFLAYFFMNHALPDFIKCVFLINKTYLQSSPVPFFFLDPRYGLSSIWNLIKFENGFLWLFSAVALALVFITRRDGDFMLVAFWAIFSFVGVATGTLFFGHYYIHLIPGLSLLSALALVNLRDAFGRTVRNLIWLLAAVFIISGSIALRPFYFQYNPHVISIMKQSTSDFVVAEIVARELKKIMAPDDQVFVWAAEPEVYFYLGKKAPGKYLYYYYWMKRTAEFGEYVPDTILRDLQKLKPRFVVRGNYNPPAPRLAEWIMKNYNLKDDLSGWRIGMMGWRVGERKSR